MTDKAPSTVKDDSKKGETRSGSVQEYCEDLVAGLFAPIAKWTGRTSSPQSISLFMTGLPNVGKSTLVASLPALFGDDFEATEETRQSLESEYGNRVYSPRATYKPVRLCFTAKNLIKGRYDRTFVITDDGGEWLEPAMDQLGGQDEGVVGRERLRQIKAELHRSQGFLYLVPWDDLNGPDAERCQHLAESFHSFELALRNRFARPNVAIVVTRCDVEEGVLTPDGNHFTGQFRDKVTHLVKKVLEPRVLSESSYRVFPISSLGFDNLKHVDSNGGQYHTPRGTIRPLGGREVFRWIAGQQSLYAGRKAAIHKVALLLLITFISLFGLVNLVQPAPETASMKLGREVEQEIARIVGSNGDGVDALSSSIKELNILRTTSLSKIAELTSEVGEDEKNSQKEAIDEKVNVALEKQLNRMIERANGELKTFNDGSIEIGDVETVFHLVAKIHSSVRDPEDRAKVDQFTNSALSLARSYREQKGGDHKELVDAAKSLASKVSDEGIDAFLTEIRGEVSQSLYAKWQGELRSIFQKHSDAIARFEKIRELSANEKVWATDDNEGAQKALDEIRKVHAYAEFMVGSQNESGPDRFKRAVTIQEVKVRWYEHPDLTLSDSIQVNETLLPEKFFNSTKVSVKERTALEKSSKSIVIDWKPGQKIRFELNDELKGGDGRKPRRVQLIVLDSISPQHFPRGQEIHLLNQSWVSRVKDGREVTVRLRVEGLPECPRVLKDVMEEVDGARPQQ